MGHRQRTGTTRETGGERAAHVTRRATTLPDPTHDTSDYDSHTDQRDNGSQMDARQHHSAPLLYSYDLTTSSLDERFPTGIIVVIHDLDAWMQPCWCNVQHVHLPSLLELRP